MNEMATQIVNGVPAIDPVAAFAPAFERDVSIIAVEEGKTYNYAARGVFSEPVVRIQLHGRKCATGQSWLYVAVAADAALATLRPHQKLYVGSQTQDRMFRGDGGVGGSNFHHKQMRDGGSDGGGLIDHLRNEGPVEIFRASRERLSQVIASDASLRWMRPLLCEKHLGEWCEDLVLMVEKPQWRWNIKPANKEHAKGLRELSLQSAMPAAA
jgi:hypothetical protein